MDQYFNFNMNTWALEIVGWTIMLTFDICALIFFSCSYYMEHRHICKFDFENGKLVRIGKPYQDEICIYSRICWEYKCICGKTFHSNSWEKMIGWVHYDIYYQGKKLGLRNDRKS